MDSHGVLWGRFSPGYLSWCVCVCMGGGGGGGGGGGWRGGGRVFLMVGGGDRMERK